GGGHRCPLPNGRLGELGVSAPPFCHGHREGGGIVDDLVGYLTALESDRGGGADRRGRCHRRHMGSQGYQRPRRSCPGTLRGHIDDDRDRGVEEGLDDVAHRHVQTTGRVEADDDRDTGLFGPADGIGQVVSYHRGDRVVHVDEHHVAFGGGGRRRG